MAALASVPAPGPWWSAVQAWQSSAPPAFGHPMLAEFDIDPAYVNLNQGSYARSSKGDAVQDFVNQLLGGSKTSEGELPYELLRRADYSVRRYPAVSVAEVAYDVRPEGYDMLGSYTGGFNEADAKMQPFLPSIITVPRSGGCLLYTSPSPRDRG